jgi:23S rRNA (cytidine1920-2'-O)/16S rRNA (cytidine1409-2'-O)-methyltransferase
MSKIRLDLLLVERGMAESRAAAQRLIMAGQVRVKGQVSLKPSILVTADSVLTIDQGPKYVSRGGEKLAKALEQFGIDVNGLVCADVGASTGGFTDCLLQHGARQVYAIDVGSGILHWKLRQDRRVIVMEDTNARFIEKLPSAIDLVTVDASFISLKILLPVVQGWLKSDDNTPAGQVIALIKPQFEAGRQEVARGQGVIRDPVIHQRVLLDILAFAQSIGYSVCGLTRSPILGPKGNAEFLTWLSYPGQANADLVSLAARVADQGS